MKITVEEIGGSPPVGEQLEETHPAEEVAPTEEPHTRAEAGLAASQDAVEDAPVAPPAAPLAAPPATAPPSSQQQVPRKRLDELSVCPGCGKTMKEKTLKYSHVCHGPAAPKPQRPAEPAPKPRAASKAPARRAAKPKAAAKPQSPQDPEPRAEEFSSGSFDDGGTQEAEPPQGSTGGATEERREVSHPPSVVLPPKLDHRHTPALRARAYLRQGNSTGGARFAGLLANSLPG